MRRNRLLCLLLALTLTLSGCAAAAAATAAQEEKNCQLYYLVRDLDRAAGGDAGTEQRETEHEIVLTIRIPKSACVR